MTVLITGGAGYIGSHMVLAMRAAGETPVVVDNLSTGFRSAVPDGVPLIVGDVGDVALIEDVMDRYGVRSIVHFAARLIVPESVADPLAYYDTNTAKTMRLFAAAVRNGIEHFVFSSTAAVYGETGSEPVAEDAPTRPLSPYGQSKLMTERILADVALAHPGLRYAVLRYFNVAGADPDGRSGPAPGGTHLLKAAVETALGRRPHVEVFGRDFPTPDGTGIRDYIHVSDLADAHRLALDHLRKGGPSVVCNCGYGVGRSVLEVLEAVRRVSGTRFPVRFAPRRPGDPAAVVARADRIRALGWRPRWCDLDAIVTHALAWERASAPWRGAA
jgi:UDP-glucose 4-epimerase